VDFWRGFEKDKLYRNWDYGIIEGLFWQSGVYNATIFEDYLDEVLPKEGIFKKLTVGATDTRTGQFVRFTEEVGYFDMVYRTARSSAALPGIFEAVKYNNMTLVDGGVVINLDIAGAIDRCKDIADNEEDIIVDVIMCNGDTLTDVDTSKFNSIQMLWRYHKITQYQNTMHWINHAMTNNPRVNFRYIVVPKVPIDNEWIPIDFSLANINKLIDMGISEAKRTVESGPFTGFKRIQNIYNQPIRVNPTNI
jgi:predicted patatin/cPLA2 family phospholipase